jgi:hypothetical protein
MRFTCSQINKGRNRNSSPALLRTFQKDQDDLGSRSAAMLLASTENPEGDTSFCLSAIDK